MSAAPAALAGPRRRKGRIAAGLRRRSGRLGSGRRVRRRPGAAAAAAQADAVCRPLALRRGARRRSCAASACGTGTGSRARTADGCYERLRLSISWISRPSASAAPSSLANDEFFAPKENLIKAGARRSGAKASTPSAASGWTAGRRGGAATSAPTCTTGASSGSARRGIVRGVDVDTAFFTGNYPESCAIDACDLAGLPAADELASAPWREMLPRTPLKGDAHNLIAVGDASPATHLRLRIFPDGGVARLRVYGEVVADWERLRRRGDVDLAAAEHGGVVVACSDMFFGSRHNLIMPGDATHMGDGWETKRRRGPGHDWTIVRLGAAGAIRRVEVDTRHFKGNAPGACSLEAARRRDSQARSVARAAAAHAAAAARAPRVRGRAARHRRRDARAAQHFSRRRRRPAAAVRAAAMSGHASAESRALVQCDACDSTI